MTRKSEAKKRDPRPLPASPRSTRAPTGTEIWYLQALKQLSSHLGRPPKISELATYCERTRAPIWEALMRLETKGVVERNADGRFLVVRESK